MGSPEMLYQISEPLNGERENSAPERLRGHQLATSLDALACIPKAQRDRQLCWRYGPTQGGPNV